jgi:DNA-binding NarL/FixJ family response regulator
MSRVFVVDDHPLVAMVLAEQARVVFAAKDVEVAGCVDAAIARARELGGADVCVLDLGLPGCKGIEALVRFRAAFPAARVVVVSANEERAVVLASLEAGAAGYIPKTSKASVVTSALRLVAEGGTYVPPQALEGESAVAQDIRLTCRQLEVLRLLARGLANKEIAQSLRIAQDTVKQHAKAVYAALGVRSRAQASRAAQLRGVKLD